VNTPQGKVRWPAVAAREAQQQQAAAQGEQPQQPSWPVELLTQ